MLTRTQLDRLVGDRCHRALSSPKCRWCSEGGMLRLAVRQTRGSDSASPGYPAAMRWFPAYSPDKPVALGGHAVLTGIFNGSVAAFAVAQRRSGRHLPERLPPGDLVLL